MKTGTTSEELSVFRGSALSFSLELILAGLAVPCSAVRTCFPSFMMKVLESLLSSAVPPNSLQCSNPHSTLLTSPHLLPFPLCFLRTAALADDLRPLHRLATRLLLRHFHNHAGCGPCDQGDGRAGRRRAHHPCLQSGEAQPGVQTRVWRGPRPMGEQPALGKGGRGIW